MICEGMQVLCGAGVPPALLRRLNDSKNRRQDAGATKTIFSKFVFHGYEFLGEPR
jgi:hypothetical protein